MPTIASDLHLPANGGRPLPAAWLAAALAACALPMLLAYNAAPSSTFLNQALALAAWAVLLFLVASAPVLPAGRQPARSVSGAALAALLLMGLAAAAAPLARGLPWSLANSALAMLGAAAFALTAADASTRRGALQPAMACLCLALAAGGAVSAVIAFVQVFAPAWADGSWIAATSIPGRAAGNLRQPNHLSSVMLWALVALVWLSEARRWPTWLLSAATAAFVLALVLSVSRTGALGLLLLSSWALFDRGLLHRTRVLLLSMPVVYGLCWYALLLWSDAGAGGHGFEGATRFSTEGDVSSSRFAIWSDTLSLIARHPWFGVGFGDFNFAWTLTPFPHRPVAFFDHTHNLPLHLAVELGLPLAALVLVLLGWALWQAFRAAGLAADRQDAVALRAAFMLVLLMAVHSLLEYPLWYAYFLLPTAFALGLCLGGHGLGKAEQVSSEDSAPQVLPRWPTTLTQGAAIAMFAASLYAVVDYWKVVVIFSPGPGAAPLVERIEAGKRSVFFAHHAHYAAATTAAQPSQAMDSFKVASHFLLDTRLMLAWAKAYDELGDKQRARHLADRLREFHNGGSEEFFAACKAPTAPAAARPFQCEPATAVMDERDFR